MQRSDPQAASAKIDQPPPVEAKLVETIGPTDLDALVEALSNLAGTAVAIHETDGTCCARSAGSDDDRLLDTAADRSGLPSAWSTVVATAIATRTTQDQVDGLGGQGVFAQPILTDGNVIGCVSFAYGQALDDRSSPSSTDDTSVVPAGAQAIPNPSDPRIPGMTPEIASLGASLIRETFRRRTLPDMVRTEDPVLRDTPAMLFVTDPCGRLLDASDFWLTAMGYARDDLVGLSLSTLLPARSRETVNAEIWPRLLRHDQVAREPMSFVRKDGIIFEGLLTASWQVDADDTLPRFRFVLLEHAETEGNRSQINLTGALEDAKLHRQVFELSASSKLLVDPETGEILDVNPAAARFYGHSREEMRTLNAIDFFTSPEAEVRKALQRAKSGERVGRRDRHRLASGEVRHVEVQSGPIEFNGRTILFMTVSDITDRLVAEESARESLGRLAEAQRLAHLGSWHGDIKTGRRTWSDEQYRIFGFEPQAFEPTFETAIAHVHPDDRNLAVNIVQHDWELTSTFDQRFRIVRPNGEVRHLHIRGSIERDDDGRPINVLGTTLDVTERKELESELRRAKDAAEAASAAKSQFLANMSHELRTPLNSVIGFSELMRAEIKGPLPKDYAEYADLIFRSGKRLLETINLVLDLSKIEAGKFELDIDCILLTELVNEVVALMQVQADAKGIELKNEIDPTNPCRLNIDPIRAKQVLINILGNAVKFTDHGHVVVSYKRNNGQHAIIVSDTGIGMSSEEVGIAVKPFEQVHRDVFSRRMQGSGLGLSLSKRIMELHGGMLEIASAPSQGTDVTLSFPI